MHLIFESAKIAEDIFMIDIKTMQQGDYKSWYAEKFGITKRIYNARKRLLAAGNNNTVKTLLCDVILPHISAKIKEHIENECMRRNIQLVYKQFNGSFGQSLPDLINANDYKKRIKQQKERQREDEA